MRSDLTELVCIIDRSGSMATTRLSAEEGFNAFIDEQKKDPGETRLTLVEFNTSYEKVFNNVNVKECPRYFLSPSGGTALYSAIKKAVKEVGERLSATPEYQRPAKVIVVIVTDGEENSSYYSPWEPVRSSQEILDIISHQRNVYSWQFTFIGSNIDALKVASDIGIMRGSAMTFAANDVGTRSSYGAVAQNVSRYKAMNAIDYEKEVKTCGLFFTAENRNAQTQAGVDANLNKVN